MPGSPIAAARRRVDVRYHAVVERIVGSLRPTVRGARFVAPTRRPGSRSPLSRTFPRGVLAAPADWLEAERRAPLDALRRATQGVEIEGKGVLVGSARLGRCRFRWASPRHGLHGPRAGIAAPWRG
jgi:hypothetical protein